MLRARAAASLSYGNGISRSFFSSKGRPSAVFPKGISRDSGHCKGAPFKGVRGSWSSGFLCGGLEVPFGLTAGSFGVHITMDGLRPEIGCDKVGVGLVLYEVC